jgi:hypothetical protein
MALEVIENGGASRDRTDDLIVANDALSQLSYSPTIVASDFITGCFILIMVPRLAALSSSPCLQCAIRKTISLCLLADTGSVLNRA